MHVPEILQNTIRHDLFNYRHRSFSGRAGRTVHSVAAASSTVRCLRRCRRNAQIVQERFQRVVAFLLVVIVVAAAVVVVVAVELWLVLTMHGSASQTAIQIPTGRGVMRLGAVAGRTRQPLVEGERPCLKRAMCERIIFNPLLFQVTS